MFLDHFLNVPDLHIIQGHFEKLIRNFQPRLTGRVGQLKIFLVDFCIDAQKHHSLNNMLQFSHISGPRIPYELLESPL